ncbi:MULTISPECIES: YczE/YyaS/YitT family protein [Pontibacillus]|uniref:Membrane protein n=1 Tax=Pontibacillus chungwhensis TaxID=265426 RepID=A0ABY8V2P8_9BACI|nr:MULTISPECIES: membrane protein [Pontibacillus]MCD5324898.1 membrane protein [Pontibacillus sp. HN14]WIF98859.1 membrane protein [Pontibacillus chungwhensis]
MSKLSEMYHHYLGSKQKWLQFALYLFGIIISSLGLALLVISAVGVAPGDSVALGLSKRFDIKIGYLLIIGFIALVLVNAKIEGKRPRFESLFPILLRGWTLNLWLYNVLGNTRLDVLWAQWGVFAIGVVFMGLGIGMYLRAPFPHIPVDHFMMIVNEKTNQSKRVVRILFEFALAGLGLYLGGWDVVGLGTVITAIFLGPIIQYFFEITGFVEQLSQSKRSKEKDSVLE